MKYNLTVAVILYKEPLEIIYKCLDGISNQLGVKINTIVLDQSNNHIIEEYLKNLNKKRKEVDFEYKNIKNISLSYARNKAIKESKNNKLLYIDPDAIPISNWGFEMASGLEKDDIGIVGSKIVPKWLSNPNFLIKSDIIKEQYSILDMGCSNRFLNKVIGASFGIDIRKLGEEAYFDEKMGRQKNELLGGEETDLCRRALNNGIKTFYIGKTFVYHQISERRCKKNWILNRLYKGGVSKEIKKEKPNPIVKKRNIYDYLFFPIYFPPYLLGYLRQKIKKFG